MWKAYNLSLVVLCMLVYVYFPIVCVEDLTDEGLIYQHVKTNYIPVRPRRDPKNPVTIFCTMNLLRILDLDARNQEFHVNAVLFLMWTDELLTWNLTEIPIHDVELPASMLWTPDVAVVNSVDQMVSSIWRDHYPILAMYNGPNQSRLSWPLRGTYRVQCQLDITLFPFDEQTCSLDLGTVLTRDIKVNLTLSDMAESGIITYLLAESYEFQLLDSQAIESSLVYEDYPESSYSIIKFEFKIRRLPQVYLVNIIYPCVLLSFLGLLALCLPAETGEKVSLQVTVLLAFTVFQLVVTDTVPQTATIPIIVIYISVCVVLTASALVCNAFVLWLYHRDGSVGMPRWLHITFRGLARLLCMQWNTNNEMNHGSRKVAPQETWGSVKSLQESELKENNSNTDCAILTKQAPVNVACGVCGSTNNNKPEDTCEDWQVASRVVERLLIIIFATIFILFNIAMVIKVPNFFVL